MMIDSFAHRFQQSQAPGEIYVEGAGAISAAGFDWRGSAAIFLNHAPSLTLSQQLQHSHGSVLGSEIPPIPASLDVEARTQKLMSLPARFASIVMRLTLLDARWSTQTEDVAVFFGVGASAGSMAELERMLAASLTPQGLSLPTFGQAGLAACNPLFAFQLMNNFTLCHGAIANQCGGSNGAFFSRGTGTDAALMEAVWQLAEKRAVRAVVGAADSAHHAVTWARYVAERSSLEIPGEAAACLALSAEPQQPLARITRLGHCHQQQLLSLTPETLNDELADDIFVVTAGMGAARAWLAPVLNQRQPDLDLASCAGDALAATPALAWTVALDRLQSGRETKALVLSTGMDGGLGWLELQRCD